MYIYEYIDEIVFFSIVKVINLPIFLLYFCLFSELIGNDESVSSYISIPEGLVKKKHNIKWIIFLLYVLIVLIML